MGVRLYEEGFRTEFSAKLAGEKALASPLSNAASQSADSRPLYTSSRRASSHSAHGTICNSKAMPCCPRSSSEESSITESRLSDCKLKPLPPDPLRYQVSVIAPHMAFSGSSSPRFGFITQPPKRCPLPRFIGRTTANGCFAELCRAATLGRRGSNSKKVRLSIVQFFRDALSQNTGAASPDVLPRRNVSLIVAILAVAFILELPKPDVPNFRWGVPSAGINTFTQTH